MTAIIHTVREGAPWSRTSLIERFEAKYIPEPNSGCWLWIGSINQFGYGRMLIGGRLALAHRFAYQTFRGHLVDGMELDHLCRNTYCVNPDHLEQVTHAENVRRGGRMLNTGCPSGHPFSEENTWINPRTGWRQCRQCNRDNYYRMKARRIAG